MENIVLVLEDAPHPAMPDFDQRREAVQDVSDRLIYGPPEYLLALAQLNARFDVGVHYENRNGATMRVYPPLRLVA